MKRLEVQDIHKRYGKQQVLRGITFSLHEPGITALVGPNGVGKTTLLNIIANVLAPDSGTVRVFDKSNRDVSIFHGFSYVMDNRVLYDFLTGYDHLKYVADTRRLTKENLKRAIGLLEVGPFLGKKVSEYSLGMKQQLLFTMAAANRPKLLLLDEPFNGLDPSTIIRVRKRLQDFCEEGMTVLLSSHNLSEVDLMTSRILFLKDGQLLQEDISRYRQGQYFFQVEDTDAGLAALASFHPRMEHGEIVVEPKEHLQEILEPLTAATRVHSMRRSEIGSEMRYRELCETDGNEAE